MVNILRALCVTASVAVSLVMGCSAIGLDRIPLPHCENDEQCRPANERFGIRAGDCSLYQCNEGLGVCELRSARDDDEDGDPPIRCGGMDCDDDSDARTGDPLIAIELCDGVDNDCDALVDETAAMTAVASPVVSGMTGATSLAGAGASAERALVGATGTSAGRFASLGAGAVAGTGLPFMRQPTGTATPWWDDASLVPGCVGAVCTVTQTALAPSGREGEWFAAVVSTGSCAAGAVRIGRIGSSTSVIELRGPLARSNVFAGFDLAGDCNGAGRSSGERGATRPAIAATLPGTGVPQAFVAWIGDPTSRASCGGSPAPVEGFTVWLESSTISGTPISYLSASNDALPVTLGMTTGGGAPAVLALAASSGFVVGFGAADGVALRRLPLVAEPAPLVGRPPEDVVRPTPSAVPGATGTIRDAAGDHVAISLDGLSQNIGVAYRTGCGGPSASIRFALASVDGLAARDPVELFTGVIDAGPFLVRVETLALGGYQPPTGDALTDSLGGWVVLWASGGQLSARRVLDDGSVIDPASRPIGAVTASVITVLPAMGTTNALATYLEGDVAMGLPICGTGRISP